MLDAVADERSERGIVGRLRQKNPSGDARFVIRERSVGRELDVQRDAVNVFRVAEKSRGEIRGAVLIVGVEEEDEDLIFVDGFFVDVDIGAEECAEKPRAGNGCLGMRIIETLCPKWRQVPSRANSVNSYSPRRVVAFDRFKRGSAS